MIFVSESSLHHSRGVKIVTRACLASLIIGRKTSANRKDLHTLPKCRCAV